MELIDSHCHPHFDNYDQDRPEVLRRSASAGVNRLIAVGCSLPDSVRAASFAEKQPGVWFTAGSHPHDGRDFLADKESAGKLKALLSRPEVVGIGEIGLDYYHEYTSKADQEKILRIQLEAGLDSGLPFVFHVREAFADFWKIFDEYSSKAAKIRGVIHSFSAPPAILDEVLSRGLYVGLNGLLTYTKEDSWRQSAKEAPLDKILLETDAPFLTPLPYRGERCEPWHTAVTAKFLAKLRSIDPDELAASTVKNTEELFGIGPEKLA